MCGIAGIFAHDAHAPIDVGVLVRMGDAIAHRGPDGSGTRFGAGYGFVHRRLAIIDLAEGAQPMGADEVWVTFNGEIYNYLDLRKELEAAGYRFRTKSDTEVLLHGWRAWGERLPERLRGMFAFALVDERTRTLFCARDRLGKKPLYWTETAGRLVFASEPKALFAHGGVSRQLDPRGIGEFLCLRYVPDPRTVYSDVHKLAAAHSMTVRDGRITTRCYWRLSHAHTETRSVADWSEAILAKFDEAVRIRLMSEVPLGAFLSGGVDSFAVVESMARVGVGRVVACTMGFDDPRLDERVHARSAAAHCGATLHEEELAVDDLLEQDWFDATFDEPFADSSAVPTYHVSRLARRHVTVAISGDGGDEAFAGYRRYKFDRIENRVRGLLPRAVWKGLGIAYPKLDWLPRFLRYKRTFENLARDPAEAYARSVSAVLPEELAPLLRPAWRDAGRDPLAAIRAAYHASDAQDPLARAAATDYATWLPGDILVKVDRASMAVSLEVRAPFLDHELVELAARLPSALKLMGGATKGFLRETLRARLGSANLDRPKQGFSLPLRAWLAGRCGDQLEGFLGDERLDAVLDTQQVQARLREHRSGLRDHRELLWAVLCLGRFLRRWT
ncbi:MAG: asparagine synthase (glutamine-hydrolyzing) [Planctomycetes bacterium]|nr:asparagine synthase (glutamine-hydrolyzing) [Planctomycetota bacterium]